MHPDLNGIVAEVNKRDFLVSLSTNASKRTHFTVPTNRFSTFVFSVPGWSQASYDKVHQLKFDRVVANIEATIENVRGMGFTGEFTLAYHVYQFNVLEEFDAAEAWCERHGVRFQPYFAYINDYEPAKAFLKGTMDPKERDRISRMIFTHYVDDVVKQQPKDWECPQWRDLLTIDHMSQVLLCCVLPESH